MGVQSSVGNLAGIGGPVVTGLIVDSLGYVPAFNLTAIISMVGVLLFALGIPRIAPVVWRRAAIS
jgi:ACS family D-galactonate transporter-like MFS transporter